MKKTISNGSCVLTFLFLTACSGGGTGGISNSLSRDQAPEGTELNDCLDCPVENSETEIIQKSFSNAPTDFLFVLDESCSMSTIANSMRQGFDSLLASTFPNDTRMGVTYMSPSYLNPEGDLDFSRTYHPNSNPELPGYLQLVTQAAIDSYTAAVPKHSSAFPKVACDTEWFGPKETNQNGDSCLSAAVQLANVCTGVEAGLVSLEHLLAYKSSQGQRLFREGAFVNIVLVSDTHEPGAAYWGRPGAKAAPLDYEDLISVIRRNSPGISSFKLGGILPVPIQGSPILNGLNVIGPIPQNADEAKVNGEGFWDYSYMDYIKASGGAVSHAKSSDWTGMAESLIEDSKFTGTLFVDLSQPVKRLRDIRINGERVLPILYTLGPNKQSVRITYKSPADVLLSIEIDYEP